MDFDNMTGVEFESFCCKLLSLNGFVNIQKTPVTGDQGVDIIAMKDGIKYAIQCKCYTSDLGNTPVQEVHAGKSFYNCHVGVVMANRQFTQGAIQLADATGVLLWDRDVLINLSHAMALDASNNKINDEQVIIDEPANQELDYLFKEAGFYAIEEGKISTSMLQRKFSLGFTRAARILDELCEKGIVEGPNVLGPRKALISYQDFEKLLETILV